MIVSKKFEYGNNAIEFKKEDQMLFEPVDNINNPIFDYWEKFCKDKNYPFAVYLVKERTREFVTYGKLNTYFRFTAVTNDESINDLNNPSEYTVVEDTDDF